MHLVTWNHSQLIWAYIELNFTFTAFYTAILGSTSKMKDVGGDGNRGGGEVKTEQNWGRKKFISTYPKLLICFLCGI